MGKAMRALLCCCMAMLLAATAAAQAPKQVVVRAARLLDVKAGRLLTNQEIVIEGDRIVSVGPAAATRPGAEIIDLPNATVLPGLIDVHTHLTMNPRDVGLSSLTISIPREALTGARNARITLLAGFTTLRNVGASGFADIALRDAINAGDVPGPRLLVSGPALGITGGHCDNNLLPFEYHKTEDGVADGIDAVQRKTREIIKYGADLIKICATGGVLSRGDDPRHSQYTPEELRAIVNDAHRLGRKVAAHAHGAEGILWATQAGVDSIEHASYIDDAAIAEMKKRGTYLVPHPLSPGLVPGKCRAPPRSRLHRRQGQDHLSHRPQEPGACFRQRRQSRLRHRRRRLPARPQRPRAGGLRQDGHDPGAGHPDRHPQRR